MTRKILGHVPKGMLQQDLEKYRQRAMEIGATDANIISTDLILIDDRVRAKCIYPKCGFYGTNANCPPYGMELDMVRKIVKKFHYAIFTCIKVGPEVVAGKNDEDLKKRLRTQTKNHEMISRLEAEAFYDGYHFAMGFATGTCKHFLCPTKECSALVPGQGCRHPLKARASMEGVGMDAFAMAARIGWDVYPIGGSTLPSDVPHGVRLGLLLVH
jgi:predicted metal-binding protein